METVYKNELPTCDLCGRKARYDTKTKMGSFANLCEVHNRQIGVSPTTKLEEKPDNEVEEPDEVKTVTVPPTMDSVVEVNCPYCDHPRRVEPDANYTVDCEACGNEYRVSSLI
jgi:ribosomal protein S27E